MSDVCPSTFSFPDSNLKTLCPIEFKLDGEIDHHSKVVIGVIPLQSFLYFYFFLSVYNLANNDNKGRCTYGLLQEKIQCL